MAKNKVQPSESAADLWDSISKEALEAIRDKIRSIRDGEPTPGVEETAQIAQLAHKGSMIAAEIRKADKEERDSVREITPGTVREWLQAQTPEVRARIRKDLDAMDATNRKSVLG